MPYQEQMRQVIAAPERLTEESVPEQAKTGPAPGILRVEESVRAAFRLFQLDDQQVDVRLSHVLRGVLAGLDEQRRAALEVEHF